MATTSLWAVRGNIRDVVAYVKDPNKTANPDYDLQNVLSYAVDNDKTEKQYFVTGLNCSPHFAFERMSATKERYGKRRGIVAYHGYQSFKPGELTPELCHEIGVLTAKQMWGDRFEVIVRNVAAGSFSKRMGVAEGTEFKKPIVEFSYKDDALNDPFINDDYAREMGAATEEECASIKQMALLINETLKEFFMTANLRLIDFKIEFGRLASDPSQIVLADEISPDTCRLWDVATGKKMDKDRFRQGLGGFMEAYADVLDRLQK